MAENEINKHLVFLEIAGPPTDFASQLMDDQLLRLIESTTDNPDEISSGGSGG